MSPPSGSNKDITPPLSFVAGGIAGGIEAAITYPFELAKTRVQLRSEANLPTPRNPLLVISQVIRNEGVRSLYLGCSSLILGTILKDAVRFVTFDTIKSTFQDPETGRLSVLGNLASGISAGVVASTLAITPTERIKTALIDDARANPKKENRNFKGPVHATRVLMAEKGWIALYRGYVTTTLKSAGTASFRLGTYNILKDLYAAYDIPQGTAATFGNGAIAGIVTTYATQPIDTIKTRAQSVKGAGTMEAARDIYAEYGMKGFWRGSTMRLGRTILAGGVLFTSYEWIVTILQPVLGNKAEEREAKI